MEKSPIDFGRAQFSCILLETNYDSVEVIHPALLMKLDNQPYHRLLHYNNTLIKTYDSDRGYDICDHIAIGLMAEDSTLLIRICDETQELADFLIEAEYPYLYQSIPEAEILDWAIDIQQEIGCLAIEDHLSH
ncbi:MAG: hypothetical protein OXF85_01055 [Candidatus Saccharibacteria bacterium]|nr:hypothetical protein [Candidatus Saccharibacteria bacterium]